MGIGRKFVESKIKWIEIEEFLENKFSKAGYSHCEVQRTPLALRIIVYAQKPGVIIGRAGKTIDEITKTLKEQFNLENPQLEVEEVREPYLDANIVARKITSSIERGLNYKRVVNMIIERVMAAGAVGIAVRIAGRLGGAMARTEKFSEGYLQSAGDPAEKFVQEAYARAQVKLGTIGVQVRIMSKTPKEIEVMRKLLKEDENGIEEKAIEGKKH